MKIIVGLGNPGQKFEKTRHNIGFLVIDNFAGKNNFPEFNFSKKFNALISENDLDGERVTLVKPQTFMNSSGVAVKKIVSNIKTTRPVLVVIHDDIDLPVGIIRIVKNRGPAGHKGVNSIIKEVGTKNFIRLRIGIRPAQSYRPNYRTEEFVLKKFGKEEEKIVKEVIEKSVKTIETFLKEGLEKAMNKFN